MPLAIRGDAPLALFANAHLPVEHHLYGALSVRHAPGGMVDVALRAAWRGGQPPAAIRLLGAGLPETIMNHTAQIAAGESQGYLSFALPRTLAPGTYSFVIQAETTAAGASGDQQSITVFSNPVTIDVEPERFLIEVDPFAPSRARRGQVLQIGYRAVRRNGFIGKLHTELAVPGRVTTVPGLRARGETFVGQTDSGSLQIMVNEDAPLGTVPFLRLFTVGVVEDQPVCFGSCALNLEIVE